MKLNIDNSQTKVIFTFTPQEYILVKCKEDFGEWSLNNLIDRSEKGKDPDIGMPVIFLDEMEADICKKAGFHYIELNTTK